MKIEITYDSGEKHTYETAQDPAGEFEEFPVWEFTTKDLHEWRHSIHCTNPLTKRTMIDPTQPESKDTPLERYTRDTCKIHGWIMVTGGCIGLVGLLIAAILDK